MYLEEQDLNYCKTHTATLKGIEANKITIETDISDGLPKFNIIGLADKSINEAKDRIEVAMRTCGFPMWPQKILVNLSPAHIRKEGVHLDLAIAASIMTNHCYINCSNDFLEKFSFLGELSLTGDVKGIIGLLALALELEKSKIKYLIVPFANAKEASLIKLKEQTKTEIYAIKNLYDLKDLVDSLYQKEINPQSSNINYQNYQVEEIDKKTLFTCNLKKHQDLNDVIGQSQAKRGFEIAAAGGHHTLMIGPPGCGKTMLAKRFISLLPPLNYDQALETTKIYSISGLLNKEIILDPPLRAPHHSASEVSLIGGGANAKPGEVSLAHNGVLFLDELTEFNKHSIELLRQILEDQSITINRIKQTLTYPAKFTLIAACNPCPCGFKGDRDNPCSCTSSQIAKYIGKLSGPILDRIDLHIELQRLKEDEIAQLTSTRNNIEKISESIKYKIKKAQAFNSELIVKESFKLNSQASEFLNDAIYKLKLSARSHQKIIKIARTIANLAECKFIEEEHLAEAMQFRAIDWQSYRV